MCQSSNKIGFFFKYPRNQLIFKEFFHWSMIIKLRENERRMREKDIKQFKNQMIAIDFSW